MIKKSKFAFTLAEVLITLGIVGLIASMTIPTIITKYRKSVIETRLEKFYSTINQALRLSQGDNGDILDWVDSSKTYTYSETVEWLETYILPYIKHDQVQKMYARDPGGANNEFAGIYLLNGELVLFRMSAGLDILWYLDTNSYKKMDKRHNCFVFQMNKYNSSKLSDDSRYAIEPYTLGWSGKVEDLKKGTYGCNKTSTKPNYCAKYIQMNSWKIPSDYPW